MKILSLIITLTLFISNATVAEKPEWAGKGKPTKEQLKNHKASMKAKEGVENENKKMGVESEKAKNKKKKIKDDKKKSKSISEQAKNKKEKKEKKDKKDKKDKNMLAKQKGGKDKAAEMKAQAVKPEIKEKTNNDKSTEKAQEVRKKWWQFF